MRIRKRFPPPSDPQPNSPVMVQLNPKNKSPPSDLPNLSLPQPSDQPAPKSTTSWLLFGGNNNNIPAKLEQKDVGDEEGEEKLWKEEKEIFGSNIDNDNKKKISFLSTPQLGSLQPSSSSSKQVDGRRCEEDHKVIPLKKRSRDNYHHHNNNNNNNTSNINTMKSKTNKKCPQENGDEEEQEHEEHYRGVDNINSDHKVDHHHHHVNKKNRRGSVILEGSRCSRVNGRGWRCCQQTLVGYSLCEHHLGKGRLRSMNNTVRNSMNNNKKKKKDKGEGKKEKSLPNDYEYYDVDDDDEEEDDKKKSSSSLMTTMKKKKMKKLGMVKARSLSSLLGQTDNAVAMMIVDNDNKNE